MAETENLLNVMLQDVLDGIDHLYGAEATRKVAEFAVARNRSRESNRVMDELERLYGPFHDDVGNSQVRGDHG